MVVTLVLRTLSHGGRSITCRGGLGHTPGHADLVLGHLVGHAVAHRNLPVGHMVLGRSRVHVAHGRVTSGRGRAAGHDRDDCVTEV